jgi:hypothetical protein
MVEMVRKQEMANWCQITRARVGSIALSVEIEIEGPTLAECVAQTVQSLREVADRIESGEVMGKIRASDGDLIGWYDSLPEEYPIS